MFNFVSGGSHLEFPIKAKMKICMGPFNDY